MIKKISICLLLIALLVGCNNQKEETTKLGQRQVIGIFKNVKVIKKEKAIRPLRYYIFVAKNGEKIKMKARGEETYDILQPGNTITVQYSKDFYIENIKFPKMEEK